MIGGKLEGGCDKFGCRSHLSLFQYIFGQSDEGTKIYVFEVLVSGEKMILKRLTLFDNGGRYVFLVALTPAS